MKVLMDVDKSTANAFLYGINNQHLDYVRDKYNILKNSIVQNNNSNNMANLGFLKNVEYMVSDSYITDLKNKLLMNDITGADNTNIYYYSNPNTANDITMKYIMSNPDLIKLYNRGLIEGYGDKYVHDEVTSANYYATVMDGEIDDSSKITTYYGYDMEEISEEDKEIVRMNWKNCKKLLKDDIDPTSV